MSAAGDVVTTRDTGGCVGATDAGGLDRDGRATGEIETE